MKYSACVFYQNCFNAMLFSGDTSGSSDCEICGVHCNDVANMLQRHIFQFPPVKDNVVCVSSGRLQVLFTVNVREKKCDLCCCLLNRGCLLNMGSA